MAKQPSSLKLTDLIPDSELRPALEGLQLEETEVVNFFKVFNILSLQMEGRTIEDACAEVGVPVTVFYRPVWRKLASMARRVLASKLMVKVDNISNRVFDRWDDIVDSMINVSINGGRDHEKVAAAELLYKIYIEPTRHAQPDDKNEKAYLNKPKNFNPMQPTITVQAGATLNITQEKVIEMTSESLTSSDESISSDGSLSSSVQES